MAQISEFRILSIKDFSELLNVSESTAKQYKKDVQNAYSIKVVLFKHFETYFNTKCVPKKD